MSEQNFTEFLEDFLIQEEAKELEINLEDVMEQKSILIDNANKANYFAKLVVNLRQEKQEINDICDNEIAKTIDRVNKFREQNTSKLDSQILYYENMLAQFAEAQLADSKKKTKSIKLPNGTLSFRRPPAKWNYGNEDELKEWIKENAPEYLKVTVKEDIDKKNIKSNIAFAGNKPMLGELELPGVTLEEQEEVFTIK